MARINIEDDLKDDARFLKLVKLLDYEPALGAMIRVWVVAQKYWKKNKSFIPKDEWEKQDLNNAVIQVGLAQKKETGIYVCGSEEHFAWLCERVEAGRKGGSKTSSAKRNAAKQNAARKKEAIEIIDKSDHKQNEANPSKLKQNEASYSYSSSISFSNSPSPSFSKEVPDEQSSSARVVEKTLGSKIFESYSDAYQARYGTGALRGRTANSIAKALGEVLGEEGIEIAKFYVATNNQFYVRAMHPLNLFKQDAQALRTQWKTGIKIPEAQNFQNKAQLREDANRKSAEAYMRSLEMQKNES